MPAFQFYREGDDKLLDLRAELIALLECKHPHVKAARRSIADVLDDLPIAFADALAPDVPLQDILRFLDDAKQDYDRRMEQRDAARHALPLSADVQTAFDRLESIPPLSCADGVVRIDTLDFPAAKEALVLEGVAPFAWLSDWEAADYFEIEQTDCGYWLALRIVTWETAELTTLYLSFADAHVETTLYDYLPTVGAPWDRLSAMLGALSNKQEWGLPMNDAERRLLPLVDFDPLVFSGSTGTVTVTDAQKAALLPYRELEPLLSERKKQRWQAFLHSPAAKPFWRQILADAQTACADYEKPIGHLLSPEIRDTITAQMRQYGLSGAYPRFSFEKPLHGVRLVNNGCGQTSLVGGKERLQGSVTFVEDAEGGLDISVVSTITKQRQEPITDEFDAYFLEEARLLTRRTYLFGGEWPDEWAEPCRIIAKTALLERLTREEKRSRFCPSAGLGGCSWVFIGLLFGLLMTAGMMILTLIVTLLFASSAGEALTIFRDAPFGWLFLFSSVAFGGCMWLLERMAR
jgi:hypothetical protein